MTEEEVKALLDDIAEKDAQIEEIQASASKQVQELMGEELSNKIADLKRSADQACSSLVDQIDENKQKVKSAVLDAEDTIKSTRYMAVFVKGRETWDTKSLSGYAKAHPELLEFKKTGNPSVSFRKV